MAIKYEINGHIVEAEKQLSEEEIDEIGASFGSSQAQEEKPSLSDAVFGIEKQPGLPQNPTDLIKQMAGKVVEGVTSPTGIPGAGIPAMLDQFSNQAGSDVARNLIVKGKNLITARAAGFGTAAALNPSTYISGLAGSKAASAVTSKAVDKVGPGAMKLLTDTPEAATRTFLQNPQAVRAASSAPEAIETSVSGIQKALHKAVDDAGVVLNEAKSKLGIPVTPQEIADSIATTKNPYNLGKDVINPQIQKMLNPKTAEELVTSIDQFKKQLSSGTSDPALSARVANALQDKINNFVDWGKKGNAVEGVLKQQYGDLANAVDQFAGNLQGAKGAMSQALEVFKSLKTQLADAAKEGKAEQFLERLFTSKSPVYKDYLASLTKVEEMTGKQLIKPLFAQFAAKSVNKAVGRPGAILAALAQIPTAAAFGHPLMGVASAAATIAGQSPRLMSGALQALPKAAGVAAAAPAAASSSGLQVIQQYLANRGR